MQIDIITLFPEMFAGGHFKSGGTVGVTRNVATIFDVFAPQG